MSMLYIYQNYRKSFTGLGSTFMKEFQKKDNEIIFFEFKIITPNRIINKLLSIIKVNSIFFKIQNYNLIKTIKKNNIDKIFIFKGTDLKYSTLKKIKGLGVDIFGFNPDDPFNRASCKIDLEKSLTLYDKFFIWSELLVNKIDKIIPKNVHYLPFATDTNIMKLKEFKGFNYDISFIGNADEERVKCIKDLAKLVSDLSLSINIDVFGNSWPSIKGVTLHGQVNGDDYFEVIRSSKCSINILRLQNKNSNNMRTFEVPASGGILYHEFSQEAKKIFHDDDPVYFFSSSQELLEIYIKNLENIDEIQRRTNDLSKKMISYKFSYSNRIDYILNIINE